MFSVEFSVALEFSNIVLLLFSNKLAPTVWKFSKKIEGTSAAVINKIAAVTKNCLQFLSLLLKLFSSIKIMALTFKFFALVYWYA